MPFANTLYLMKQLFQVERLCEIVIGSQIQAVDPVRDIIARCQQQHGSLLFPANPAEHFLT